MKYLSVSQVAKKWNLSQRTIRNYCSSGKIEGAFLTGKTWNIPQEAKMPKTAKSKQGMGLLERLLFEKEHKISGGIYHKVQVDFTYNTNHIEGSRLTHDQTRFIFETKTVGVEGEVLYVDDLIETSNHFRCMDFVIENAKKPLTENLIKTLHKILKGGTSDGNISWFNVGDYKKIPNEVGGVVTTEPAFVKQAIKDLLIEYNSIKNVTFENILDFHYRFERIHPFQDGNGRVGRLIMFKECLKFGIVPFIIDEDLKFYYYRGLKEWKNEKGFLRDTCLTGQDKFKAWLDYFKIFYEE